MFAKAQVASLRIRRTPFTSRVEQAGVSNYTAYNRTLLATVFESAEADYLHLREHVQVWDVGCQRQVELIGPDAYRLVQLMTPRDLKNTSLLQGKYAPLCDENGGIVNDPIVIKLAEDRWWLSLADSDIRFWASGLAYGLKLNVKVFEPEVSPLAVQGPKSQVLMERVFGQDVADIKFFKGKMCSFMNHPLLVMRSGWSKQGGFEIYLDKPELGEALWDALFEAGQDLNVRAGCPNNIERVESGLISWGGDIDETNNPFEAGLDAYVDLDSDIDAISLPALRQLKDQWTKRLVRISFAKSIEFEGVDLVVDGKVVGRRTASALSPITNQFHIIAMVDRGWLEATNGSTMIDGIEGHITLI